MKFSLTERCHAGAMYSKLPNEVNAGIYNRVASLWFVSMVVIFQAGKTLNSMTFEQSKVLLVSLSVLEKVNFHCSMNKDAWL